MKAVHPYVVFPGNTEEAFAFYESVFGGDVLGILRFRDFGDAMSVPDDERNKVANMGLPLVGATTLMGNDVLSSQLGTHVVGNNVYFNLDVDDAEEARRLFAGLSAGGRVDIPLQPSAWAELYGICVDRYGVQWMVNYTGGKHFSPGG